MFPIFWRNLECLIASLWLPRDRKSYVCRRVMVPNRDRMNIVKCRRMITGALWAVLIYLANTTRPDLAFMSGLLSSYLSNPGLAHWTVAKHVLRYLKYTSDFQLTFKHDPDCICLVGYTDADYGGHLDTRRSTSGYCFRLQKNSGIISWRCKLQTTDCPIHGRSGADGRHSGGTGGCPSLWTSRRSGLATNSTYIFIV